MGLAFGPADLKPPHRNGAPALDRVIDRIDDRFELLLLARAPETEPKKAVFSRSSSVRF
jgi:hypothetical protein